MNENHKCGALGIALCRPTSLLLTAAISAGVGIAGCGETGEHGGTGAGGAQTVQKWTPNIQAGSGGGLLNPIQPETSEVATMGVKSRCRPTQAGFAIPARRATMDSHVVPSGGFFPVRDLMQIFDSLCATCHMAPKRDGDFSYDHNTFQERITDKVLGPLRDPIGKKHEFLAKLSSKELILWLQAYLDQGKPAESISVPKGDSNTSEGSSYKLNPSLGLARTNLGECIPDPADVGTQDSQKLDDFFARISGFTELPDRLSQTDLFSLETDTLARSGTLHYAPNYTLWADDTVAERFIHVPKGKKIGFDAILNSAFDIPTNTRFYRTVLHRTVDSKGRVGWRKLETQLILVRPDASSTKSVYSPGSVFGTYVWNEDETEATLLREPYRDGTPFRDKMVEYIVAEGESTSTMQVDGLGNGYVEEVTGRRRTYPVAAQHRCIKCHQGSSSSNFVLGFTPLQVNRRNIGEGGTYDPVGPDELTQVDRLVSYGLFSGLSSGQDLPKLEDPTPDGRQPRNKYELRAQAYMVGNCASCHSPGGSASSIRDLDFTPGGVFQFPLGNVSQGLSDSRKTADNLTYLPYLTNRFSAPIAGKDYPAPYPQGVDTAVDKQKGNLAPWDSLLYRNVETPFTYAVMTTLYPHMPQSVPGHDCRAANFMATWMLSIPTYVTGNVTSPFAPSSSIEPPPGALDPQSQQALVAAQLRVATYNRPCIPALKEQDTIDQRPEKLRDETGGVLLTKPMGLQNLPDGIPDAPHWVVEDFTVAAGSWEPAQKNWSKLVKILPNLLAYHPPSDFEQWATACNFPYDKWAGGGCDLSKVTRPYVGTLLPWMTESDRNSVYYTAPGAAVYESICGQCHGERGNSESKLATALAELSGGRSRVSNFQSGLFGPTNKPLQNFGALVETAGVAPETDALRYFVFMAAGGTTTPIPNPVLAGVKSAPLHSRARPQKYLAAPSANMLDMAAALCGATLPFNLYSPSFSQDTRFDPEKRQGQFSADDPRIAEFGERELWSQLCQRDNPAPVRVLKYDAGTGGNDFWYLHGFISREAFEKQGDVELNDALAPFCVFGKDAPSRKAATARGYPLCPDGVAILSDVGDETEAARINELVLPWAERGAFNAGAAAFFYLKQVFTDPTRWQAPYNRCDLAQPLAQDK